MSAAKNLKQALTQENPLQIAGTINAMSALLAQQAGFKAIYLSGAGVANASFGLPDLGMTTRNEVLEDARRILSVVDLPLLVDIDTGWGNAFNIARTIKEMINAGVSAVHLEDQIQTKRCGHRPNKQIVATGEMTDRIKAAVDARTDDNFTIIARTDALANEGLAASIERSIQYTAAGADMIFFEGASSLEEYSALTTQCKAPVLANITEFGLTPLFTVKELKQAGIQLILYPLSAFRAMNLAAQKIYSEIKQSGSQKNLLATMQTRTELYDLLKYTSYEKKLDQLFSQGE